MNQVIEYEPNPCFRRFGESVSAARRAGDEDPDKATIADTMKLLGNVGDGRTVTNVDRHRDVKYCIEIGTSTLINNKRFRQREVVTEDAYEIEMNKSVVKYTLPLHIGIFVYHYAKLRMLRFYYVFVDRCVERPLFQYCEMGTDSGVHCAGWRKHRQCRSSCALLPTHIPMASGRMLRLTRRRLCP